jgi:hypothetical protein
VSFIASKKLVFGEIVLIFAVFAIHGGWPAPEVNEPYYIGKAIHYWNPDWLRGDFFLESADTHEVFYFLFGWMSLWLSPTAMAWAGRIIIWLPLAWAWRRLSTAVVPWRWCSVLSAALFVCLLDRCNMAGEWVVGGVEAKGLAYVFIFLGLEALVRNRWNPALLLFGAASAFHVLVGGWAAVAAGLAWLVQSRSSDVPPLRSLWPGILGGLLLALPGVIPSLALDWGVDAQTTNQAHQIYVFDRLGHHLALSVIRRDFIVRFVALTVFWLLLGQWSKHLIEMQWGRHSCLPEDGQHKDGQHKDGQHKDRQHKDRQECLSYLLRLRAFVAAAVFIALLGAALHLLIYFDRATAANLLRYYWFRLSDVAVPLGIAIEGTLLAVGLLISPLPLGEGPGTEAQPWSVRGVFHNAKILSHPRGSWLALAILVAAFHLSDLAVERIAPSPPRSNKLADFDAWRSACDWVARSGKIPPDARFITPRAAQTFSWYAGCSQVVSWKDIPQDARKIVAWWDRLRDVYGAGDPQSKTAWRPTLSELGPERLRQLGSKYDADYAIVERTDPPLNLEVLYRNNAYIIYRLR